MRTFLLFLAYCLFVTPVGLVRRVVNDPMTRRWNRNAETYWIPSGPQRTDRAAHRHATD